ncbi:MAG: Secreted protein, suppressor for copper-sensitivity ScsC [uncultured Sulfurovum sp.]|uniref:Secreted protein, suppressor for copper-sensitivity ScsC n=1 Tax=uncultured Sulfurovum sp. TaxID=269237 RepID=A0A6S6SF05_9BACT|nr:MAG: Secreted protein, suppressor for copper-sensitivity ScsC [uncultured Sulfurovum sp.]
MRIKILLLMILATAQLLGVSQKSVEFYVKKYIEKKTNSPVKHVETLSSYVIEGTNGWKVYFLSLEVSVNMNNQFIDKKVNKVVFNKGSKIAFSLKDSQGKDYANILKPKVPMDAYNKKHLLAGNVNAKHKVLVMSDPFCPYCQEIVPKLIEDVQKNPSVFALYYYHLPLLRIHPASDITTKAMHIFQERGQIRKLKQCYHLLVSEKEKNPKVILKAIEEKTGVYFTQKELNNKAIVDALAFDLAMKKRLMVTGTPTIFIDGTWDPTRMKYKELLPRN